LQSVLLLLLQYFWPVLLTTLLSGVNRSLLRLAVNHHGFFVLRDNMLSLLITLNWQLKTMGALDTYSDVSQWFLWIRPDPQMLNLAEICPSRILTSIWSVRSGHPVKCFNGKCFRCFDNDTKREKILDLQHLTSDIIYETRKQSEPTHLRQGHVVR